jgi:dephospho-CoA kinase
LSIARAKRTKPIIGLVGGIGSGKSAVASVLQGLGAMVIDSDRLAHAELNQPDVVETVRSWWGDKVCRSEGGADRKAIAAIVFADAAQLDRLEKLLYPRLHRQREAMVAEYDQDPTVRAVVLDAPKLYEAGLGDYCDAVIFVDAAREQRLQRVRATRGWSEGELDRREGLQDSLDRKKADADHVVINDSSLEALQESVTRVFFQVLAGRRE